MENLITTPQWKALHAKIYFTEPISEGISSGPSDGPGKNGKPNLFLDFCLLLIVGGLCYVAYKALQKQESEYSDEI